VAAAAVFDTIHDNDLVRDSKQLTARQRSHAAAWIRAACQRWAVVESWVEIIDRVNILGASKIAMRAAVESVAPRGATVVVDAVPLDVSGGRVIAEPKADARYFCVAAASILAKVHRDGIMSGLVASYPHWQWQSNKGYGTAAHRRALQEWGLTVLHRRSFRWSRV
jgi:ribonuclease HII